MKWLGHASRRAVRMVQPLVPRDPRGVTIITYHLVGGGTHSPVDLPVDVFASQLDELAEFAQVVSLPDALDRLESSQDSLRPIVVITFDDAFDNFRTAAWPLLKQANLPCTLYVPVGFLEGQSGSPLRGAEALPPMTWNTLGELASDPLLTIGSHSWCHDNMPSLATRQLRDDLRQSRECLRDRTGQAIDHFCYPRASWSRDVEQEVGAVYRSAVIAGGRRNVPGHFHPLRLGRIPVRRDMPVRLAPIVRSTVWLEEWAASYARTLRFS